MTKRWTCLAGLAVAAVGAIAVAAWADGKKEEKVSIDQVPAAVKATIQAVGTVQEEVGLKGARTSAFGLSPDVAIATDVTIPGDHPGVSKNECHVCAGKGPSITILDAGGRGVIAPRPVVRWLRESAERESIPHQFSVGDGGNTDATAINITKAGIPCGVICVPARYIHSPVEVLSLRDLDNGAALIAAAIERVHEYF